MSYSPKEIRIILLVAEGMSSHEIAKELNITFQTVSNHRKRIMAKSPYRNWNQFMATVGRNGLLDKWEEWQKLHARPKTDNHSNETTE